MLFMPSSKFVGPSFEKSTDKSSEYTHSAKDIEHGEDFADICLGSEVSIPHGGEGDYAEVERIKPGEPFNIVIKSTPNSQYDGNN